MTQHRPTYTAKWTWTHEARERTHTHTDVCGYDLESAVLTMDYVLLFFICFFSF